MGARNARYCTVLYTVDMYRLNRYFCVPGTVPGLWIGNFPNPNFVFPIFPIFPGKYKKQVYKSGYEFVKQNISQVFISEIYFPGNMGNINYISREIYQRQRFAKYYRIIYVYNQLSTDIYPPKKTLVKFAMRNGSNSHFFTVYPLYFPGCQGILSKVCNCIMVKLCLIYRLDFILSILSG